MIGKLVVGAIALASIGAHPSYPARTEAGIAAEVHPEIVQVRCLTGSGTAFYVGPRTLVSVAHVTSAPGCFINGKRFEVVHQKDDFTILRVQEATTKWLSVDCKGFVVGRTYAAWGFARGLKSLTSVDGVFVGGKLGDFAELWGVFHAVPGQSGGPYIDEATGKVPGAINVYNHREGYSGSTELRGTVLCA